MWDYDSASDGLRELPSASDLLALADAEPPVEGGQEAPAPDPEYTWVWKPEIRFQHALRLKIEAAAAARGISPERLLVTVFQGVLRLWMGQHGVPRARPLNRRQRRAARRAAAQHRN